MPRTTDAARTDTPPEDRLLGYGPMLLIAAAAGVAVLGPHPLRRPARAGAATFAGAILCFLSGVRRGTSFYTPGGARAAEAASFLWLFGAGFAGLVAPPATAAAVLAAGYGSVALIDRRAARRGRAPRFFATLRPRQMLIATAALLALAA